MPRLTRLLFAPIPGQAKARHLGRRMTLITILTRVRPGFGMIPIPDRPEQLLKED